MPHQPQKGNAKVGVPSISQIFCVDTSTSASMPRSCAFNSSSFLAAAIASGLLVARDAIGAMTSERRGGPHFELEASPRMPVMNGMHCDNHHDLEASPKDAHHEWNTL